MLEFNRVLDIQIGADHCSTAMVRTFLKLATPPDQWGTLPSQIEIGREVFITGGNPPELWSPPETNMGFLRRHFNDVKFVQGESSGLLALEGELKRRRIVAILCQDLLPDEEHPFGYPNDGDQGHYEFVRATKGRLALVGDPSRLIPGNRRWFNADGVVLSQPFEHQPGFSLQQRSIYLMELSHLLPNWWDRCVPPNPGVYFKPFISVDPASRRPAVSL